MNYDKLIAMLLKEAEEHRGQAINNMESNAIWISRVAASHVLSSLALALREAVDAERK